MQEINSPEKVDMMVRCAICPQILSESRVRRRSRTCSERCKDRLDFILAKLRDEKMCTHCLKPTTPEEREEFRLWRAQRPRTKGDRGALRSATVVARDSSLASKKDMLTQLRKSTRQLSERRDWVAMSSAVAPPPGEELDPDTIISPTARAEYDALTTLIQRNQELLDRSTEE